MEKTIGIIIGLLLVLGSFVSAIEGDYYTAEEMDSKLGDYYTAVETNTNFQYRNESVYVEELVNYVVDYYYTAEEVDSKLENYYTKEEIDLRFNTYLESASSIQTKVENTFNGILDKIITYLKYLPKGFRQHMVCGYMDETWLTNYEDLGLSCSMIEGECSC